MSYVLAIKLLWVLAIKLLWRDWRSGELTLLLTSLIIAVSTVTTIALFVDRLQQALMLESASFLAADRLIISSNPVPPEILQQATALGLHQAETLSFLSMVFSKDRAQLSSVKAVSENYPLRGELMVASRAFIQGEVTHDIPDAGDVWIESRLIAALDMQVGDYLDVGMARLRIAKVLVKEPDRGGGFENTGPRVLMNLLDVSKTEVVQPGSRLTYRYLFSGATEPLTSFEKWVKPVLPDGSRILGVKQGIAGIDNTLARAEHFLLLGGLLGVVLAGIAIALSAHRYSRRHFDHVAILKTLGASPTTIDSLYLVIFIIVGVVAAAVGSLSGYVMQGATVHVLAELLPVTLPEPGWKPVGLGFVTGLVCLLSFALPPLLQLRSIAPLRVIRRDLGDATQANQWAYLTGIAGVFGLMWWYSNDLRLTLTIFAGGCGFVLLLATLAFALLRCGRVLGMQAGSVWRLALAGMQRRGAENTLHILVFGLSIMLLLILYLVRTDLIQDWRAQIPANAPNHFVINISPDDIEGIHRLFSEHGIASQPLFPMIRGRISTLDRQTKENLPAAADANRPARNLTFSAELPEGNKVVAGHWWSASYKGPPLVSVETDLARQNHLSVGDRVGFSIQGRALSAEVASIRAVSWNTMRPNFYMILSPGALDDFPATFMTSFYLQSSQKLFLNTLLRRYPTMTVIEVDAIIAQIQAIIDQVTLAIELILGLILISSALVLLASIQASLDERFRQQAMLRTLGAGRRLILGSLIIEFCVLGLFAGILATLGAEFTVYILEEQVFEMAYKVHPSLWISGPLLGAVLIGTLGTLATAKVVKIPPTIILRESG